MKILFADKSIKERSIIDVESENPYQTFFNIVKDSEIIKKKQINWLKESRYVLIGLLNEAIFLQSEIDQYPSSKNILKTYKRLLSSSKKFINKMLSHLENEA